MYCIFREKKNCVVVTECHWKKVAGLSRWVEKDQRETESEVGNLCGLIYCNYRWHLTAVVGFSGRAASHALNRMFAEIRKLIVNIFPASSLMLGIITPHPSNCQHLAHRAMPATTSIVHIHHCWFTSAAPARNFVCCEFWKRRHIKIKFFFFFSKAVSWRLVKTWKRYRLFTPDCLLSFIPCEWKMGVI